MSVDVITFGEAMIRFNPPGFRRLEQATSLDVLVGGAELNTAVALAQLGRSHRLGVAFDAQPAGPAHRQPGSGGGCSHRSHRLDRRGSGRPLLPGVWGCSASQQRSLRPQERGNRRHSAGNDRLDQSVRRGEMVPRHRHHACLEPRCSRDDPRGPADGSGRRRYNQYRSQLSGEAVEHRRRGQVDARIDPVLQRPHHHRRGRRADFRDRGIDP